MELKKAQTMALDMMEHHGLRGTGTDWYFEFDHRSIRRGGDCFPGIRRIRLAARYVKASNDDAVLNTILHEIAHALVGSQAGHGPVWKAAAIRVGATPERCINEESALQSYISNSKYHATCPGCGRTLAINRMARDVKVMALSGVATHTCRLCRRAGKPCNLVFKAVR